MYLNYGRLNTQDQLNEIKLKSVNISLKNASLILFDNNIMTIIKSTQSIYTHTHIQLTNNNNNNNTY